MLFIFVRVGNGMKDDIVLLNPVQSKQIQQEKKILRGKRMHDERHAPNLGKHTSTAETAKKKKNFLRFFFTHKC